MPTLCTGDGGGLCNSFKSVVLSLCIVHEDRCGVLKFIQNEESTLGSPCEWSIADLLGKHRHSWRLDTAWAADDFRATWDREETLAKGEFHTTHTVLWKSNCSKPTCGVHLQGSHRQWWHWLDLEWNHFISASNFVKCPDFTHWPLWTKALGFYAIPDAQGRGQITDLC